MDLGRPPERAPRGREARTTGERPELNDPFPGMDPYLEHAALWEGVHARLIVAIANQLQPRLDPRYITSIEERVFIEGPQRRIPDVWIQKAADDAGGPRLAEVESDTALIVEVEDLETREGRVEILDSYSDMKLIALIEVVSPTKRRPGRAASPTRPSSRRRWRAIATSSRSTCFAEAVMSSPCRSGESGP
jgi:hypothetical protein